MLVGCGEAHLLLKTTTDTGDGTVCHICAGLPRSVEIQAAWHHFLVASVTQFIYFSFIGLTENMKLVPVVYFLYLKAHVLQQQTFMILTKLQHQLSIQDVGYCQCILKLADRGVDDDKRICEYCELDKV